MNYNSGDKNNNNAVVQRREFLSAVTKVVGGVALLSMPVIGKASGVFIYENTVITVGDIMDLFMKQVSAGPVAKTVDTLKAGSRDIVVKGIVTTMFATIDVITKAIDAGANFIIAHEPAFYNHTDDTSWLQDDNVYQYKANLLQQYNIAVWRNHDYIHSLAEDGVRQGVLAQLNWKQYDAGKGEGILLPSAMPLQALIQHVKTKACH